MDEWFLPHTAMGFACWDLTNSAVSLLTVYPKKLVLYGWFDLCTLIMMWSWQQSSLQHIARLPQGALVGGSLCISQSFRHNLHQIRNSSGVWLMNYFNLSEVFSFLEDLISLGQDLVLIGWWTHIWPKSLPSIQRHLGISISTMQHRCFGIPLLLPSVPLSVGILVISHVPLVLSPTPVSTTPPCFPSALWFWYEFCGHWQESWLGWGKTRSTSTK